MSENEPYVQLQMVWPEELFAPPPVVHLPAGYSLRTYRASDEQRFYVLMALAGWPDWDDARLSPWLPRIPAECWFMVIQDLTAKRWHARLSVFPFVELTQCTSTC